MATFEVEGWPVTLPLSAQCYEVPNTRVPGQTGHYRSSVNRELPTPGGNPKQTVTTTYECFEVTLKAYPDFKCLGRRSGREYVWQTYAETSERRLHLGSALQALFNDGTIGGGDLPTIGIWTINRPEWQLIDLALSAYNKVGVPLYSTLGKDSTEHIINEAEITLVFVEAKHIDSIIQLAPKCPKLRILVSIDQVEKETLDKATESLKAHNVKVMTLEELEASGKAHPLPPTPPKPDDIATICYTSGTSGPPKGAVLSHWNLTSSAIAFSQGFVFRERNGSIKNGAIISYLPLAHIVGRIIELTAFLIAFRIGYYSGDPLKLIEDCQILQPTIFPSVPRVLNRIAVRIQSVREEASLKGTILRLALGTKIANVQRDGTLNHWFWDWLIFSKLKAVLGGKVEYICSGAAPVAPEVAYMLRAALGCELLEGWGLTETCGSGARSLPHDPSSSGTVGICSHSVELKLIDNVELGYSVEDKPNPRGELCVRGPSVFKYYYKDPESTAKSKDNDGWFHTGDVGEIDSHSRIKVIDRIKNVIKLSQGEKIALEKVENAYSTCAILAQLFVYGQSSQNYLVALVVPELPAFAEVASKVLGKTIKEDDKEALGNAADDGAVKKEVLRLLDLSAKDSDLQGFEKIKKIKIVIEAFSTDNKMMTPTFKLRRREIQTHYKEDLEALYRESA